MTSDRRTFLKCLGGATAAGATLGPLGATSALASSDAAHGAGPADPMGVLVDLTACIGCRLCEYACKQANDIDAGPLESYDDQSVFAIQRRPAPDDLTVVNAWSASGQDGPVYAKLNCMHCNHAACVSACIVGALQKQENGAVTYDAWKCIGCRYCMVACPFQLPSYEYDDVLTPEVRKCQFCFTDRTSKGEMPACVKECPRQTMVFGKRKDLLALAHERIAAHPDRYIDHVYGEHEVGGTSWMYMSAVPFEQAGFLSLGQAAPPALTEAIQHGVFKYWIAPVGWYAFLSTMFWWTGRKRRAQHAEDHEASIPKPARHLARVRELETVPAGDPDELGSLAMLAEIVGEQKRGEERLDDASLEEMFESNEPPARGNGQAGHHTHEDHSREDEHHAHPEPAPVNHKLLTPGVWFLLALVGLGGAAWLWRFIAGLAATTNLNQQYPWGLWIAMDVGSGIALAGGGFVAAAIFHVFHREHYHTLARSALITALLGYTFYVPGLLADIGRWYNIWHPTLPNMWQGNSVLFEVGICVMLYLNVQYAELAPIVCERLGGWNWLCARPALHRWIDRIHRLLNKILPALLVLGVTLSTFHQSSLGNLMVIAPYKLHHLWWSPLSPLLFLLSAMMVGLPMVIFTILFASWSLNRRPEMHILTPLARNYVPVFLVMYLAVKIGDMVWRGTAGYLVDGSYEGVLWMIEVLFGVIAPLVLFLIPTVRRSPRWLGTACLMVILGVVLNRLNVFVLGYHPPFAEESYFPSLYEFLVSLGLVAALLLVYRVMVTYLPILTPRQKLEAA